MDVQEDSTTGVAGEVATVTQHGAQNAPRKGPSKKRAKRAKAKKVAPKRATAPKAVKSKPGQPKKVTSKSGFAKPKEPRPGSEGAKVLELLRRAKGVTLTEIMKSTKWQAHSVRGFLSIAAKKYNVTINSTKSDAGDCIYRIA
jgi:hypothetical protein